MASDLKIRFSSNFLLSFWWMQMCLATLRPLKFFKRKKRKKESHTSKWKVSKKQVFQKKYYPIRDWNRQRLIRSKISFEIFWVEIFSETRRAWTCFFEYLELIFALFFFIFYFEYSNQMFLFNRILSEVIRVYMKDTLSFGFDFWGCLKVSWQSQCSVSRKMSYENVKHLQKTMHHTTECDVAVAQVRVSFFICLLGCFWLLLWKSWCLKFSWQSQCSICSRLS